MLTSTIKVYIVDDSTTMAEMLCELISDPGRIEIAGVADSVRQAIEVIPLLKPDVVIVDLQLKDGSGFEVVKALRAIPQIEKTAIILFTNHASRELDKRAKELGANFFLDKSRDHATLLEVLQEILQARRGPNGPGL